MKVTQSRSNYYVITVDTQNKTVVPAVSGRYLQSYDKIVAWIPDDCELGMNKILVDPDWWDYSPTTAKHVCLFTGVCSKDIRKGIANGTVGTSSMN